MSQCIIKIVADSAIHLYGTIRESAHILIAHDS